MSVVTEALIQAIIARQPRGRNLAEWIGSEVERLSRIREGLDRVAASRHMKRLEYEEVVASMDRCERVVRSECPHYVTTNNVCDLCGGRAGD